MFDPVIEDILQEAVWELSLGFGVETTPKVQL